MVELQCTYFATNISVNDGIREKKITFWKIEKNSKVTLNKRLCLWYFQAQGQLYISERKTCVFSVWTNVDIKIELIEEDK